MDTLPPTHFLLLMCLLTGGCATTVGTGIRDAAVAKAVDAYDESLENAEFWVCKGASAGSVVRRYGASEAQWDAWKRLCRYEGGVLTRPDDPESSP